MYKKITHNIIEEHFDYPVEPAINGVNKVSAGWPMLPNAWNYTTAMRNQFNHFNNLLRAYTISVLGNNPDAEYVKTELMSSANDFANFFEPYYGQISANSLVSHLTGFATAFVDFVNAVNSGQDVSNIRIRVIEKLTDFVKNIYTVNPQWWTNIAVKPDIYVTTYAQALMEQATARKAKNWTADTTANETAVNIIANGPIYSSPFNGNQDFATLLAISVSQQFPQKFN